MVMTYARTGKDKSREKKPGGERSELHGSAVHLLHRAGQCAEEIFTTEFQRWDLTPRQYAVLVAAYEHSGGSQTDIVERTGIDRSTLADLVRRLLKKGLLQRRRTREDARAYAVRLTDAGREIVEASGGIANKVDAQILAALSASDREKLVGLLGAIVRHMQKTER